MTYRSQIIAVSAVMGLLAVGSVAAARATSGTPQPHHGMMMGGDHSQMMRGMDPDQMTRMIESCRRMMGAMDVTPQKTPDAPAAPAAPESKANG